MMGDPSFGSHQLEPGTLSLRPSALIVFTRGGAVVRVGLSTGTGAGVAGSGAEGAECLAAWIAAMESCFCLVRA